MEECAEAIMEASKAIRFGQGYDRLEAEIGDIYCMLDLMHKADMFSWNNVDALSEAKYEKLKKWSDLISPEEC